MIETVSVIIPNYNREQLLKRTISSVLKDATVSAKRTKIIVVDDGSTDNSFNVAKSFGSNVQVVKQEHLGSNAARNRGLALASGEYIRFVDSDDWLKNTGVTKKQVEILERSGADVCYGNWLDTYEFAKDKKYERLRSNQEIRDPVEWLLDDKWCAPFCYLFRRDVVLAANGWNKNLSACQDFDFILRIALNGSRFVYYNGVIGHYYHHSGSRVSRGNQQLWCDCKKEVMEHAILWLSRHNDWTLGRRRAVANSLLNLGKIYFGFNRNQFRKCIQKIHEIYPHYRPPNRLYRWLVFFGGYYSVEMLLQIRRNILRPRSKQSFDQ